jgi:hypothetical protein
MLVGMAYRYPNGVKYVILYVEPILRLSSFVPDNRTEVESSPSVVNVMFVCGNGGEVLY